MTQPSIRFADGAVYERMMGVWSALAGEVFLDWVAPAPGLAWIDIGCGNGAFTELLMRRCAPAEVQGIDPSEGQIAFARKRPGAAGAHFQQGDALALPFDDKRFDAAVMALVLFFVPDPAKGVAEMARVVRPGGQILAYLWDFVGHGFPFEPIQAGLRAASIPYDRPPHAEISTLPAMRALWENAGLEQIESRAITVRRSFASFEEFWEIKTVGTNLSGPLAQLTPDALASLQQGLRAKFPQDAEGRVSYTATANAIRGRVPR